MARKANIKHENVWEDELFLMHERKIEHHQSTKNGQKPENKNVINSNNEIYEACRDKPKFHRYARLQTASTDEGLLSPERSDEDKLLGSPNYSYSPDNFVIVENNTDLRKKN